MRLRLVLMSLFLVAFLLFSVSCAPVGEPDPRTLAPQEFSGRTVITRDGFSAEATLTRTGNGTYALQFLAPDTVSGLTYTWMPGEQTWGFGMLEETSATRSDDRFGALAEAMEIYFHGGGEPETGTAGADEVQYVYKEFTILANAKNGQILEVYFPQSGLFIQIDAETT